MSPQPWCRDGVGRGTGAQLELPLMGSISKSTVELLGHGHLAVVGERGGCPALLPRAGIPPAPCYSRNHGDVLLEDGSDTDPASGGEDGVSLCLTFRNHDPLSLLLALHHPITISFATRPAGQGAGELQVWCKNKPKD